MCTARWAKLLNTCNECKIIAIKESLGSGKNTLQSAVSLQQHGFLLLEFHLHNNCFTVQSLLMELGKCFITHNLLLCPVGSSSSPANTEFVELGEIPMMKELELFNDASKRGPTSGPSGSRQRSDRRPDGVDRRPDSVADNRRKRTRKSRISVKNEPTGESSVKTIHRQYHRPPTPDTSPIRLLPFSPSQVYSSSCFYVSVGWLVSWLIVWFFYSTMSIIV